MSKVNKPESDLFRVVFDASPTAMLVVDDDVVIQDCNQAAALLLGQGGESLLLKRGGEVLHCLHSFETPQGCGHAPACQFCVVRQTVGVAFAGNQVMRQTAALEIKKGEKTLLRTFLVSASPFEFQGCRLVLLGLEDISEVVALRKLIPICANCKKIRDDRDFWVEVEQYFELHLGSEFSHGICPDCAKKLYPDLAPGD